MIEELIAALPRCVWLWILRWAKVTEDDIDRLFAEC